MKVRPNKFDHIKNFRSKWIKNYKLKKLKYGQYGIKILNYLFLTARHINRYKIFMHLSVRRGTFYHRKMWVRYNLALPITKKPKGSRMGSGKGKTYAWGFKTFGGTIIFELKNISYGRATNYYNQFNECVNCYTKFELLKSNPLRSYSSGYRLHQFTNKMHFF